MNTEKLPVYHVLSELRHALRDGNRVVLCAPPGSGKTTVVAPSLLQEPWLGKQSILLLEPRRIAARLAAEFMARQMGQQVGATVGYRVRFDSRVSATTRIEVLTEGMFIRRIQDDPELSGVGLVIFDEFHERSLDVDLGMALCLDTQSGLRDDLRLLVMSATLDRSKLEKVLGGVEVIEGQGESFAVETVYLDPLKGRDSKWPDHIAANTVQGIKTALEQHGGDILTFLPGMAEIRRTQEQLASFIDTEKIVVLPLHGSLSLGVQHQAVVPDSRGRRRIILATTIAESSLTIEGITVVVDSGWKRVPRFDANCGLTRLETMRISRASAEQRRGRAGRLAPGWCYRLWNRGIDHGLIPFDQPEILQADLTSCVLELACWGVMEIEQVSWVDRPPGAAFAKAKALLHNLDALDERGRVTAAGRRMAGMPLHPRLAHMLLQAERIGMASLACDIAALLSERDIMGHDAVSVDIEDRLSVLSLYRRDGKQAARARGAHVGGCGRVAQVSRQLARLVKVGPRDTVEMEAVGGLLVLAYPDRIGRKDRGSGNSYSLVNGKKASLPPTDPLVNCEWLTIGSMDAGRREGRIFLAAEVDAEQLLSLFEHRITTEADVVWDEQTASIRAVEQTRLGELVLKERPIGAPDPERIVEVVLGAVRNSKLRILPWSKKIRMLQARLECIALWQPEICWPDFSDIGLMETVDTWLGPFLDGVINGQQLRRLNLEQIFMSRLPWSMQQQLATLAPTHLQVPSGSRIPLVYKAGESPVLAVRLQEMFGLDRTPAVCQGRVPVLLHLLSPASRPVQVTSDLGGFWNNGYHEVKRELKGRYPKHHWPDDPWEAEPTARVKPRRSRKG